MDSPHKTKSQKYISLPVLEQESLVTSLELESALINFKFPFLVYEFLGIYKQKCRRRGEGEKSDMVIKGPGEWGDGDTQLQSHSLEPRRSSWHQRHFCC